jgi:hypothetical protein
LWLGGGEAATRCSWARDHGGGRSQEHLDDEIVVEVLLGEEIVLEDLG